MALPAETVDFVREQLERNLVAYCSNISACRVVQIYIENYGDRLDLSPLLEDNHHLDLAQKEYGNHVVQCILKPRAWYSEQPIFVRFRARFFEDVFTASNLLRLSRSKQGSHVIESCIRTATPKEVVSLAKCVCARGARLLREMIWDEFGNYVLRTLFNKCCDDSKMVISNAVNYKVMRLDSKHRSALENTSEFIKNVYWFRVKAGKCRYQRYYR